MVLNPCRFCEHENPANSNFCSQCGGQLNLLACPRCGAVSDITAESCYQCHGPLSGNSTAAFDRTSPATEDFRPSPRQYSQDIDEAAAFAEIKQIYHGLSQPEADDLDRPSPATDVDRPDALAPRSFTADVDRPSARVPPSFTADVDNPYRRDLDATADPRERALRRRRARRIRKSAHVILGVAILATMAALGYHEYHQRFLGDALRSLVANSEQRGHDGPAGAGAIRGDKASLKTIPGRDIQRAPIEKKIVVWDAEKVSYFWKGVVGKTAAALASLVPETPEPATAPAPEPPRAATAEKAQPAPARTPAASASLVPETPEPATPPAPEPARAATAEEAQPLPAKTAAAAASPVPQTRQPAPAAITKKARPVPASVRVGGRKASSEVGHGRSQVCPGPYNAATWTNCAGEVTLADGSQYFGEFRDGQYHGQGTVTLPDGETYVGEFKRGKRDGQGTATFPDGRKYVGQWRNNKASGQGTGMFPSGEVYVGEWREGRTHGHGAVTYPDGRKYVGEWRDYRPDGVGIEYGQDGSTLRSGFWVNGSFVEGS